MIEVRLRARIVRSVRLEFDRSVEAFCRFYPRLAAQLGELRIEEIIKSERSFINGACLMDASWLEFRAAELRRSASGGGRRKILFIPYLPLFRTGVPRISIREDAVCLCKHYPHFPEGVYSTVISIKTEKNTPRVDLRYRRFCTGQASRLSVKIHAQSPIGLSPAIFTS